MDNPVSEHTSKEGTMKIKNFWASVGALAMTALFAVTAAPVRAGSTDDRIKALEDELTQLKGEQDKMKEEAAAEKAAAPALPTFRRRPGRGLSIGAADKSWEFRVSNQFQARTYFFPDTDAGDTHGSGNNDGPSQGSTLFRHIELDFNYLWQDGLYQVGMTQDFTRAGAFKKEGMRIYFDKFSPYYPSVKLISVGMEAKSPHSVASSTSGLTLERQAFYDVNFTTGSETGYGLVWSNVPIGMGQITDFDIAWISEGYFNDSDLAADLNDQSGVILGLVVEPFSKTKGVLKGIEMGIPYVNANIDTLQAGSSDVEIRGTVRGNRFPTILDADARGRMQYVGPWVHYTWGPAEAGFTYEWFEADRDFQAVPGTACSGSNANECDELTVNVMVATTGLFVYGPQGFLSGSRNNGLRLSWTWSRHDTDLGNDPGTNNNLGGADTISRNHVITNAILLRWFQAANMNYALQWQFDTYKKVDSASIAKRLGIGTAGGTSQSITLGALWRF